MPHQCTTCGQTFDDGSKEMLSGCPQCGGNKFQYLPSDVLEGGAQPSAPTDEKPPSRAEDAGGVTEAMGRAATTVRDYVSSHGGDTDPQSQTPSQTQSEPSSEADAGPSTDDALDPASSTPTADVDDASTTDDASPDPTDDAEPLPSSADDEDSAQASARGEMVDRSDLPTGAGSTASTPPSEGRVVKEPDSTDSVDRPALDDLRRELNEQFESIRIVAPGQYELNLMELYDREEHIIALQEDGRYVIQVPDSWRDEDED